MKKIILLVIIVITAYVLKAQTSGAVVTTIPANFTALDQIKIIVDVSNVGNLTGKEPLYFWTWDPGDPAPGNGDWGKSNEARKMVKEGTDKWSLTMTPADYYGKAPGEMTQIQFLVKAKDGSGDAKTTDQKLIISPLIFTPTDFRTFPSTAGQNELITVYFDQTLAKNLAAARMTPTSALVVLYSGASQVGSEKIYTLKREGPKQYSFSVLPKTAFAIPAGTQVTKMTVEFEGTIPDTNGNPVSVGSGFYEKLFDELK